MKYINLTKDKKVIVDDQDFEWLNQWKWHVTTGSGKLYARGFVNGNNEMMHRVILGIVGLKNIQTDHVNGNGLDNRRENLRIATQSQNLANISKYKKTFSKYKGVMFSKFRKGWYANLEHETKRHFKGYFKTEIEAARAYNYMAIKYFGEFARVNDC